MMIFFQGIQRLILTNCMSANDLDKFERVSLELIRKGNEEIAIPALKLLMTCIYIGEIKSDLELGELI